MTTPILGLTELTPTTSERSTIIDAHRVLDAMWGRVAGANINIHTPPTSPVDGTSVLIGSAPTGDFSGFAGHLALFIGTGWQFISPDKLGFVQTDVGPHEPNVTLDGWVPLTLPAGNPLTTKGDIITYNNGDVRLAVGTNGQVLAANSATPTGLEWVTPTSGGSALTIEANGTPLSTSATKLNFTNFAITEPNPDEFDITAPASGAGGTANDRALAFQYEADDKSDAISGRTLSTTGTVSLAAGKTGNAFSFTDNSANRLTAQASEDSHIFGNKDWFIGAWVNPATATGFKAIYAKDRYLDRPRVFDFFLDGTNKLGVILGFENNTFATYVTNAVISANVFTHVLATHHADTKTVELYVNGALDASFTHTETAHDTGIDIPHIGVRRGSTNSYDIPFNGLIDQLIKGDFLPTTEEITALYNSGDGVADAQSVLVSTTSGTENVLTFTDTFTDTNGTAITAHALDTAKSPNWIPLRGDAAIQNNRAEVTVNNQGCLLGLPVGSINSGSISAIINSEPGNAIRGIFPRGSDDNNFLLFAINPDVNEIDVTTVVNGTFTKLQTVSKTINANQDYNLRVDFVGGFYEFYVDNVLEITLSTGEHINGSGWAGIRLAQVGDKADDFNLVF